MDILTEDGKRALHGISATITLEFESEDEARSIYRSVEVDNYSYIQCCVDGSRIICTVNGKNASSLRNTIDDLLACVITAESAYQSI